MNTPATGVDGALTPEKIAARIAGAGEKPTDAVARYAVRLGDDALILAQRLGAWIAHAPELEEDVALANIALDQIGHARSFLSYAALAWDKTEDDLAYFRGEREFTSLHLFEQPNGDFARTIARQLVASHYQYELYRRLTGSADPTLAAIAAKAVKEVDYHRDHSVQWVLRLGDRHRGVAPAHGGGTGGDLAVRGRAVPRRRPHRRAGRDRRAGRHRGAALRRCARTSTGSSARCSRRPDSRCRSASSPWAADAPAPIRSISGRCWRKCRCSPASIRERVGDDHDTV